MANESTKVQNPRRNSYAGITPCIEQQVPIYRLCILLRMRVECLIMIFTLVHYACARALGSMVGRQLIANGNLT